MMYAEYRFKKKTKQKTLWKTYTNATKKTRNRTLMQQQIGQLVDREIKSHKTVRIVCKLVRYNASTKPF